MEMNNRKIELVSVEDVKNSMHDLGIFIEDNNTLDSFMNMCIVFNISSEKLAESWYSYQAKNPKVGLVPSTGHLDIFQKNCLTKDYILDMQTSNRVEDINNEVKHEEPTTRVEADDVSLNDEEDQEADMDFQETCLEEEREATNGKESHLTGIDEYNMINSRKISFSSGPQCQESDFFSRHKKEMMIEPIDLAKHASHPFTFLQFRQLDFSKIMDEEVSSLETAYIESGLDVSPLDQESGSGSFYCGRIMKEGQKIQKIDCHSIQLMGRGHKRIEMDIQLLLEGGDKQAFSFFPGQLLCVKALNNGLCLKVQSIEEPIQFKKKQLQELEENNKKHLEAETSDQEVVEGIVVPENPVENEGEKNVLQMVIASGPFNSSSSREQFKKLVDYIRNKKPHVVLLSGPLVDVRDKECLFGNNDEDTLLNVMLQEITLASSSTQVIIVPSEYDYNGVNIVPGPPLTSNLEKNAWLKLFPNPCYFTVSGTSFAVTSTDILRHLAREEYSNCEGDRMKRLCAHLLSQKSMYPLFPPPLDTNIDYLKFHFLKMPVKPDILITPSDLTPFSFYVNGSLCLNPQRIAKGFIARLRILPRGPNHSMENSSAQIFRL